MYRDGVEHITGTGETLQDVDERGKVVHWHIKKQGNQRLADDYDDIKDRANITRGTLERVRTCGDTLIFQAYNKEGKMKKRFFKAFFCKNKLCPMCNWRRSLLMYSQTIQTVDYLLTGNPSQRFIFVTFTIKNVSGDKLKDAIDLLLEKSSYFYRSRRINKQIDNLKKYILGGLRILEITYNRSENTYHPHLHFVFSMKSSYFRGGYVKQEKWREIWKNLLQEDYNPLVNVQTVKLKPDRNTGEISQSGAVAEVSKYPIKGYEMLEITDDKIRHSVEVTFLKNTKHRRFVSYFGNFKKARKLLMLKDIETADLSEEQDFPDGSTDLAYIFYQWRVGIGNYVC